MTQKNDNKSTKEEEQAAKEAEMAEIRKRLPNMANRIKTYDWVAADDDDSKNLSTKQDFDLDELK